MKATGKKIAMSETVVATTASTISFDPVTAASQGERFSSSMWRKMFSSTMMASSITMPVETERPSIVTLFSVNPAHRMAKKVAMIEVGMETAAISAGRQFRQPEEDPHDQARQERAEHEVVLHLAERPLDEARLVPDDVDRDVGREGRPEIGRAAP